MPKPYYNHARKQKELARKARQQEKQQRRSARSRASTENAPVDPAEGSVAPSNAGSGGET